MQQSFRNTSEDHVNSRLAYITHEDLCSSFEGDTLLAIRAPPHTHLEVPIPEEDQKRQFQIHLKSQTVPIHVLLVNKESEGTSPIAVPVPPPQQFLTVSQTPFIEIRSFPINKITLWLLQSDSSQSKPETRRSPRKSHPLELQEPTLKPMQTEDDTEMEELVSDSFLRLSPPPSERDYYFHLDENEGLTDLFDMPISSFWISYFFYFINKIKKNDLQKKKKKKKEWWNYSSAVTLWFTLLW